MCLFVVYSSRTNHDIYFADLRDVNLFSSLLLNFKLRLFQGDLNLSVSFPVKNISASITSQLNRHGKPTG